MMCKRISLSSQTYSRFWPDSKDTVLWTPFTVHARISVITERIEKPRTPLKRAEKMIQTHLMVSLFSSKIPKLQPNLTLIFTQQFFPETLNDVSHIEKFFVSQLK